MKLPSYLVALFLAFAAIVAAPPTSARAEEATFDVFYTALADEGDWYNTPDYGYVWQPYVAYQNDTWRPYTDGYWAQTEAGWTWVSYENFGWATYHYGRWTQLETTGWVWVPGYEWGPGWVSWRQNDSYVGWAPIPPKHNRVAIQRLDVGVESEPAPAPRPPAAVHEPRGIVNYDDLEEDYDVGYNASVDTAYDIGPSHYCFVPVASFGAPYVREVILAPQENFIIIGNTYNCTNISYRRGYRDGRFIYNGGPDFGFISRHVQRPIPRLFLDRRTDIGVSSFAQRGFSPLSVVRGDRLQVVGPQIARREIRFNDVRPVRVRENLAQPRQINGWRGIQQSDPAAVQRLRAQYRQEAQVAPPARDVVNRLAAPADFRPNAPLPAPLPPPPQSRFVREQGGGIGRQGVGAPGRPGVGNVPGAAAIAPQPGQPLPGGLQPANPTGRGAQDAAEREARRNAQLQQMNERRAARGQAPLQPGVNAQQQGQQPAAGAAAAGAQPAPPQTREQARAARQQQQREAQQAAQQQRQGAAEQQRQQAAAAAEQRRQQQATAAQERAARQAEQRRGGQPQTPQAGGASTAPTEPGGQAAARQEAARARQEQAAQGRAAAQAEAQGRAEQGRAATRERAEAAAQARQQQQVQQREVAAQRKQAAERQAGQQQAAERQRAAAEARQQQQQSVAAERQRAGAEARQQQMQQQQAAQQQRGAAQAEARQQAAAQQQQARAAAQQQAQQQQAAQRAQRQQPQQPPAEGQPAEQQGKRRRPPEGGG